MNVRNLMLAVSTLAILTPATAQQAPTASYSQNWHFVVVTDPDRRAALGEIWRAQEEILRADPAVSVIRQTVIEVSPAWRGVYLGPVLATFAIQ